jgi:hypothetical protein
MTRCLVIAALVTLAACLATLPEAARGCAPAPRPGELVDISEETALIIWDDAHDTEHFIRQATFVGTATDFGFIVPTPTRPQVERADSDLFSELARITEPKTEQHTESSLSLGCSGASSVSADKVADNPSPPQVEVLEQKRIGNLEAVILAFRADKTKKFDDTADELLSWLKRNGYAARPDLVDWLKTYIENNWIVTAFKIAAGAVPEHNPGGSSKTVAVKTTAVRMSFKTETPFFPYREPAEQRDAQSRTVPRLLRVYFASLERAAGRVGESGTWSGQTVWANSISDQERRDLLAKAGVSPDTLPPKLWLTEFEDHATPRLGTDELYFDRSLDRNVVARPPIIVVAHKTPWWIGPLAIIAVIGVGAAGLMLVRRFTVRTEDELKPEAPAPKVPESDEKGSDRGSRSEPRRWS